MINKAEYEALEEQYGADIAQMFQENEERENQIKNLSLEDRYGQVGADIDKLLFEANENKRKQAVIEDTRKRAEASTNIFLEDKSKKLYERLYEAITPVYAEIKTRSNNDDMLKDCKGITHDMVYRLVEKYFEWLKKID